MGQEYGKSNILIIVYCEFYVSDILIIFFIGLVLRYLDNFPIFQAASKLIEKIVDFFSLKITQAKLFFI
jgi:hypothetical protein